VYILSILLLSDVYLLSIICMDAVNSVSDLLGRSGIKFLIENLLDERENEN